MNASKNELKHTELFEKVSSGVADNKPEDLRKDLVKDFSNAGENKLQKEYDMLEEVRVEERTVQLEARVNELEKALRASLNIAHDFRKAKEELKAKNTELEWFTYSVSHDLRSPLITLQGFVELLREDLKLNEKEKVESDLKFIESSAKKMDSLLTNMLSLSRIGRVVNPPEDVSFGEIVQEALEQSTGQIKSSGIEVSVAENCPTVHVDRMRIEEVLVNLIDNSINYRGDQSHPKIDIGYHEDGKEIVFFVRDNGIGIDKSQHEKIFDLFYRLENSGKGTGAGLAIVKRIIEVHEGRIWIESELGKGCKVCFTLPVTQY